MKKEKVNIKNKVLLVVNITVMLLTSTISVFAASYLYNSNEVSYDNTSSGLSSNNVQGAIDSLYASANNYSSINTRVTALEEKYSVNLTPSVGSGTINLHCNGPTCVLKLTNYNPGAITSRTTVATIPVGYRPVTEVTTAEFWATNNYCTLGVTGAGAVWLDPSCASRGLYINVTYPKWQ